MFAWFSIVQAESLKDEDIKSYPKTTQNESLGILKRDTPYYKVPILKNLDLIYSENFKNFVPTLLDYTKLIDFQLSKIFQKTPYFKRNSVIFLSSQTQIPNAYATVYPLSYVVMHPSPGAYFMDQWSIFYWPQDVLTHEITHIYQLSQNLKWDRKLWRLLGYLSHRNLMLNSFIVEGSAVLNESIYGFGGRLFSGWARAFVFSQLKQELPLKRTLKPYDDHFSDIEKYLHGGYFFAYLYSQYGMESISRFFAESSRLFPLNFYGLNRPLKRVFGKGLEILFEDYKKYYAPLANKQKSSPEKALLKSKIYFPMNSDENKIYFLISDMKSPPELILLDKKTKQIKRKTKNLPLGKIFYRQGKYHSSAYGHTGSVLIEYSLFKEDFKPVQKYNSQHIMDFYKEKFVSLDTRQSHIQNSLLVNNAFYDTTHSSAIMDHKGRIYYFKQNKETRTLYRDKKPLFSFKSYYAYPVEADENGLYFIGATQYGSSLFVYKEASGIFRLSDSDTIGYARKIKGNEFIVSEITPTHLEYKIIQTKEISEKPFFYTYSFKKENIFEKTAGSSLSITPIEDEEQEKALKTTTINKKSSETTSLKGKSRKQKEKSFTDLSDKKKLLSQPKKKLSDREIFEEKNESSQTEEKFISEKEFSPNISDSHKAYNSLNNLSLQKILFLAWIEPSFLSSFHFLDPLQFNEFSLVNFFSPKQFFLQTSYIYRKYRPSLAFSFIYDQSFLDGKKDKYRIQTLKDIGFLETEDIYTSYQENLLKTYIPYRDRAFDITVKYPLIIKNQWNLSLISSLQLGQKQFNNEGKHFSKYFPALFHKSKAWKSYIRHRGGINYSFKRRYKYAYSFHKRRDFKLSYNMLHTETKQKSYNTHLNGQITAHFTEEIGKEWFVTLNGVAKQNLWNKGPQRALLRHKEETSLNYNSFKQNIQNLYRFDFQILKVLNYSYYPLKIPFALRRLAPLTGLSFLSINSARKRYDHFLVPFAGMESELMLLYEKNTFKFGFSGEYFFDLSNGQSDFEFSIWLKGGF